MVAVNLLFDTRHIGFQRRSVLSKKGIDARKNRVVRALGMAAICLWLVALMVLLIPLVPQVLYRVFPGLTASLAAQLSTTVDVEKSQFGEVVYEEPVKLPAFDPSLPEENMLIIPKIGFKSVIGEAELEEVESVLRNGPWRVPSLGNPEMSQAPMVLAAHRFGYLHWSNEYRRANSFFNLPKLENGDRIEIVWNQRKYVYEIYEGYTDTKIHDYDADVILYTCEVLNSPRRIIRMARLIEDVAGDNLPEEIGGFGNLLTYNK